MPQNKFLVYVFSGVALLVLMGGIVVVSNKNTTREATSTSPQKESITIAAFGDSLTAGYGVDLSESYPYILESRLREEGLLVKVLNMGVSGETTQGGRDRVSFVIEQNPDVI